MLVGSGQSGRRAGSVGAPPSTRCVVHLDNRACTRYRFRGGSVAFAPDSRPEVNGSAARRARWLTTRADKELAMPAFVSRIVGTFVVSVVTAGLLAGVGAGRMLGASQGCSNTQCRAANSDECFFLINSQCCVCEEKTGYSCGDISCAQQCEICD